MHAWAFPGAVLSHAGSALRINTDTMDDTRSKTDMNEFLSNDEVQWVEPQMSHETLV